MVDSSWLDMISYNQLMQFGLGVSANLIARLEPNQTLMILGQVRKVCVMSSTLALHLGQSKEQLTPLLLSSALTGIELFRILHNKFLCLGMV